MDGQFLTCKSETEAVGLPERALVKYISHGWVHNGSLWLCSDIQLNK